MSQYQLGTWDLSELAKNPKSSAFQKQIIELENQAKKFEKIKSKLDPKMSSKKFMEILNQVEEISEKMSKIGGYASLSYSSDTQSDEATSLMTRMSKLGSDISNKILFFDLWWKTQVDEKNAKRIAAGTVAFYASVKTYDEFFSSHGFGAEAEIIRKLFRERKINEMIESVPDEMVDTFAIAGNKEFVKEAIDRYRGLADEIKLTPPTHYVTEEQTRFAQKSILELVKGREAN